MIASPFEHDDEFTDATFRGLALQGASIRGKDFEACRFNGCSFQEAQLWGCTFRDSSFVDCNLAAIRVTNSQFVDVVFQGSKLTGVNWTEAHWSPIGSPMVFEAQCVLDYSVFLGLKLKHAVFRDCSAREVDFSEADLEGADFSGTDLSGARFNHTNLTNARLETAFAYSIDPANNQLHGTRVALPEAASLLRHLGLQIVDRPEQ
jgi:fluoroquinolone resistance protein